MLFISVLGPNAQRRATVTVVWGAEVFRYAHFGKSLLILTSILPSPNEVCQMARVRRKYAVTPGRSYEEGDTILPFEVKKMML